MNKLEISEIQIVLTRPNNGMVAYASCAINDCFFLGNISIHTAPNHPLGYRTLFPTKKLASGQQVPCFYPFRKEAEEAVSSAIIKRYIEVMDGFNKI